MGWVNDVASFLGLSSGVAPLALALYAAAVAAEKVARPEALRDVAGALRNTDWPANHPSSRIVPRVFVWTFGERHLSPGCMLRSALLSVVFFACVALFVHAHTGRSPSFSPEPWTNPSATLFIALLCLIAGLLPDYLSLAKTRLLLGWSRNAAGQQAVLVVADLVLSLLISYVFIELSSVPEYLAKSGLVGELGLARASWQGVLAADWLSPWSLFTSEEPSWLFYWSDRDYPAALLLVLSTVSASLWSALVLISTLLIRTLPPVQKATKWFLDVDGHPVRAIGLVSAVLVMAAGSVHSLIRHLF